MSFLATTRSPALGAACVATFCFLALAAAPAASQSAASADAATGAPAAQAATLDPVVITATGSPQPVSATIAHSTVFTRQDIERSQAPDLPALLAREAGIQFSRSGGRGAATTMFLRGAPGSQVLLLVDGVPQTRQDATGSLPVEHIALDQVDRVEVVRGNVSALYGSGAIGGVVQVFTRRGQGGPGADVAVEGGSYGYWRAAANGSARSGALSGSIGVAGQRTRGFSAQDAEANPAVNPDRDGYRNTSASLAAGVEFKPGHTLGLSLTQFDGDTDYDSAFATAADVQESSTKVSTARLASTNQIAPDWQSVLALGWQRDRNRYSESGMFGFSSETTSGNQTLAWSNQLTLAKGWKANAGIDLQRQTIDTDDGFGGVYAYARNIYAAVGGVQGAWGAASVQANVRLDDIEDLGAQPSGYLGVAWNFTPEWKASASASTAFNAPPLGYLYAPFFGNPDLQAEKARSAELALQYAGANQLLRATLFQSKVRNQFQYDFATSRFENIARSENRGIEVSYSAVLGKTELAASLTRQDPTDEDTGAQLLRRAKTLASASVWHSIAGWRLGAQWAYVGSRIDVGNVELDSYSLVDLLAQWDVGSGVQIFGRIENLFDADYESVAGYNTAGLSGFVGLRWKFQ